MRLLVSVVDPAEVAAALAGGADIIDVKDPAQGALGAAAPATLRAVRSRVAAPVALSATLGDAPHLPGTLALAAFGAARCGAEYLKVGLLGSNRAPAARALLAAVQGAAVEGDPRARVVAVGYADAARVHALPPADLPAAAHDAGVHAVMLDTAVKDGTSAFAALGEAGVAAFLEAARGRGLLAGLAGALSVAELVRARELGAEVVGVRGSACEGGRGGVVSAARVRRLRAALGLGARGCPGADLPRAALAPAPGAVR